MKTVVELKDKQSLVEAIAEVINAVGDKKKKDYEPGQYVWTDKEGRVLKVATITGAGKTSQSYKEDTDVNRLLEPAMRKGLLRHVEKFEGEYDDIPVESFQDAQFIVAKGKNMFEALPSRIREKFGTADKFMAFVQNPDNKDWLIKQGVLKGLDGLDAKGQPTGYAPENENKPSAEEEASKSGQA